jgi:hypothetical protein
MIIQTWGNTAAVKKLSASSSSATWEVIETDLYNGADCRTDFATEGEGKGISWCWAICIYKVLN